MKWPQRLFASVTHRNPDITESAFLPHLCHSTAIFGLIIAGELIAMALALASTSLEYFSWRHLGLVSLTVQWIVLLSALLLCYLSDYLSARSARVAGVLAYIIVLVISLLVLLSAQYLMDQSFALLSLAKYMLLSAIFAGIMLRFLYLQQQLRYQQEAELSSRIQALHARIRPHFLFNSMNAVASLIPVDPERAEKVVEDLSQLFRVSLREHSLVSLEEEIALCRRYIDIEQVRLGERLRLVWMFDESAYPVVVPSLLLQPLLENAVYHGIQKIPEGGTITFESWYEEDFLRIRVLNPLPQALENNHYHLHTHSIANNRMAVKNIEHRLQAHYGKQASIQSNTVEQMERGKPVVAYQVLVTIPARPIDNAATLKEDLSPKVN